ncbi:MAG: TolC family protein [Betaproteobacteria bacterium HGW-Betaproteobacteria-6]|jgi:cobalt-zinc-cadmium efflux system outer membrane protein|nr:MAG: TolC family protein [Betaproteobacteria bacterium HGW-Betaproteobacteria-6]
MRHLLSALLFTLPLAAWAQTTPLTEAEAVRRGLARPDLADLEVGRVESAKAEATAAGMPPNPTLGYTRDRKGGAPDSTEETWQLSQTFDLSGRRGLRREAAESRVEAAYAGNNLRRGELAAEIRHRFHEALFKQEAVLVTETWVQRFSRVERIVDKLARAGEASGYDRRRLARERQTAEARLSNERADLDRASERLAALLGTSGKAVESVTGVLRPTVPAPLDSALSRLERRPDLQALARRAEAADLEGRAASRGWVPDVTLGFGPKRIDNGITRENGSVISVSIPLPVFDRQQAGQQRAAAEALNARGELSFARARAEGDLRGLHRQVERLVAASADYRTRAVGESAELLRIAEAAYQGGESTLLELLDAYRGALEAEMTALDLEWKARQARIDYDLLTGSVTE